MTRHFGPVTEWSRRIYHVLLLAYPRPFRERCGRGMAEVFARDLNRAMTRGGAAGLIRFWLRTFIDYVTSVVPEQLKRLTVWPGRGGGPRHYGVSRRPRWVREIVEMLVDLVQDVRYGIRGLAKSPGFAAMAVLILALGVGANTTISTLVNELFFQPPPLVEAPAQLVRLNRTTERSRSGSLSYPDYAHYRDNNAVFSGVYAYDPDGIALTARTADRSQQIRGWLVSGNYFDVLGVRPALGRTFLPEEDQTPGTHPVAVISHRYWRQAFGEDVDVIGSSIALNGHPFTVIGVAPEGFRGASPIESPPEVWLPIMMQPVLMPASGDWLNRVEDEIIVWLWAMGRLKPGVEFEAAQANLNALAQYLQENFAGWNEGVGVGLTKHYQYQPGTHDSLLTMARLLMVVAGLVLVIASANIAILLLARASARRTEIGVRVALGAGRGRVVRQLLTESLLLSLAGGIGGFLTAFWSAGMAAALMPFSFTVDFTPDAGVLGFTVALSVLTAVLFGLTPALQASRMDVASVIRVDAAGERHSLLRNVLVVSQVALSIVLVTGAVLFARSLRSANAVDLGFELERRLVLSLNLANHGYGASQGQQFIQRVLQRLEGVAGVEAASTLRMEPFRGQWTGGILAEGATPPEGEDNFDVGFNAVGPSYFRAMGIPLIAGRDLAPTDQAGANKVVVVNEAAAQLLWPDENPMGRVIYRDNPEFRYTVMGVARNAVYYQLGEEPQPMIYLPVLQRYTPSVKVLVSTVGDPDALAQTVQQEMLAIDPNVAFARVASLEDDYKEEIGRYRVSATLVSLFGFLALVLATVGLYGVLSYLVVQRTRDIGIQMALGATPTKVVRAIIARGLKLAVLGIVLGVSLAFAASRLVAGFMYGISARDPVTFAVVPLMLVVIACLASFVPARRASRVDPMEALR